MMDLSNVNWVRLSLATLAGFVVVAAGDFIIHGIILMSAYQKDYSFARTMEEMHALFWAGVLRELAMAFLMVFIYSFGVHPGKSGWSQGLRFGILMGLFLGVPDSLLQYQLLPIPFYFVPAWIGLCAVQLAVAGLVIGLVYKTRAQALIGEKA